MISNQTPLNQQQNPQRPQHFEEVHLTDYFTVILRRRQTFVVTFLSIFVAAALYTYMAKPVFEAAATLYVKEDKGTKNGVLGELSLLSNSNPINAEIEIIKSRTIAEQVVRNLHLNWKVTGKQPGVLCKVADFSSKDETADIKLKLGVNGQYTVNSSDNSLLAKGTIGQLLRFGSTSLLISEFSGKPGSDCTVSLLPFNKTVEGLRKETKVNELGKKTNIIRIAYRHYDPLKASEIVNTLVQAYLAQTVSFKTEEASRTVGFLEDQLKGIRTELDKAEGSLQGYKSSTGVVKLDKEAEELIKKFSEVEKERAATVLQKKQIEFSLNALKDTGRQGGVYSPAGTQDTLVSGMSTKLAELEIQKRALLNENTEQHPQIKALQGQIDELQKKIRATYESSLKNLIKQESDISKRLIDYEAKLRQLPAAERDLAGLTRVVKVNADIYTFLLQKHEEARIAKAATISNIKIVDTAIPAEKPVKPQKKRTILLGLLAGLIAGIGMSFFHDYMDNTVKDADEAKRILGWSFLGLIPFIDTQNQNDVSTNTHLVTYNKPKSAPSESFRSLRTALHYATTRQNSKVVLVTSTFPGEGKTTASSNLAATLSLTGAKVVLIGCDMRLPTLHAIFNISKVPGLSELLANDCDMDEALHQTVVEGLDIITAGTIPPNPAELLGSEQMVNIIDKLKDRYDHVILDAPPVLAVSDTPILVSLCDTVVVLVEAGRVPQKAMRQMREMLTTVKAPIAGFIINDKCKLAKSYGYGYGYGYGDTGEAINQRLWYQKLLAKLQKRK